MTNSENKSTQVTVITEAQKQLFINLLAEELKVFAFFNQLPSVLDYDEKYLPNCINHIMCYFGIDDKNDAIADKITASYYNGLTSIDDAKTQAERVYSAILQAQAFITLTN